MKILLNLFKKWMSKKKANKEVWFCDFCDRVFATKEELRVHFKQHAKDSDDKI